MARRQAPSNPRFSAPLILAIALLLVATCAGALFFFWPRGRPSILLLVVDTLRADYLGVYGFQGDISPTIDNFANESVLFKNNFSPAPWTKPAVASLMTSLEPQVHGLTNHKGFFWGGKSESLRQGILPQEARTLAESLQASGYTTAAFVANPWLKKTFGFQQGFELYDDSHAANTTRGARLFSDALSWLEKDRPKDRPFFLYLHVMDVHGPYQAPARYVRQVAGSPDLGEDRLLTPVELRTIPAYLRRAPWFGTPRSGRLKTWRTAYAGGVRYFDAQLQEFLDRLRESGILEEIVFVLTSDHGEQLLEHGGWDHGDSLYEHELRIPLLVRLPKAQSGGSRPDEVTSLLDIMPTLLELAKAGSPPGLQGQSLVPILEQDPAAFPSRNVIATATKRRPSLFSIQDAALKLIVDGKTGKSEFYDLGADPGERSNLVLSKPDLARELRKRLEQHLAESARHPGLAKESSAVSKELEDNLKSLGYLE